MWRAFDTTLDSCDLGGKLSTCETDHDEDISNGANLLHEIAVRQMIGGRVRPGYMAPTSLIMNGDLTEYGRTDEYDAYKNYWHSLPIPSYEGLGNHDYAGNVGNCKDDLALIHQGDAVT